jgi:dihydroxyacetone kinase phosphoprotein-dependent L subunit
MSLSPRQFADALRQVGADIHAHRDHLCRLDGEIGDGDHGVTMDMGWSAAVKAVDELGETASYTDICNTAAKAFLNAVGASAGPLYATALMRGGQALKEAATLDRDAMVAFLEAACEGIRQRGKAEVGDKTMLDAWVPAIEALKTARQENKDLAGCLQAAANGAEAGADSTKEMVARKGRASRLGDRSKGHVDPGAASAALFFRSIESAVTSERG